MRSFHHLKIVEMILRIMGIRFLITLGSYELFQIIINFDEVDFQLFEILNQIVL